MWHQDLKVKQVKPPLYFDQPGLGFPATGSMETWIFIRMNGSFPCLYISRTFHGDGLWMGIQVLRVKAQPPQTMTVYEICPGPHKRKICDHPDFVKIYQI